MTAPNYNNPDQYPDAANAGTGLSGASTTSPADSLQGQMNQVGGPLGAVAGWLLGGLAPKLIADAEQAADTTSPTGSYTTAAERVMDHIGGVGAQMTKPMDLLMKAVQGVLGGGFGEFSVLSNLMGLRWDQADRHDNAIADLQDQAQVLEGIIGHASAYMASSPGTTTSPARMPFTTQSGPLVGVENLGDGRWRLLSKGSWDISAQVEFWGGTLMPPGTFMRIVTRDPSGGVYHRRAAKASSSDNVTLTNVTNIVVPAAGYTVEVEAWTSALLGVPGATFRGISGGFETTGLYIRKVSQETS